MDSQYNPENSPLSGKTAVVTGGTTGIGRAAARLLALHEVKVLIFGRNAPELNEALADIRVAGGEGYGLTADVTILEDVRRVFDEADRRLGGLDILVNCAALPARSVAETSLEDSQYVVEANLLGTIACCKQAIERMRVQGKGHIVNIGSMAANVHDKGASLYVSTKSGIQGLSDALGKELAEEGIKVSLIEPGTVGSAMVTETLEQQKDMQERMIMLKAEDVAFCVYFCLTQPERVNVSVIQVRPHLQMI